MIDMYDPVIYPRVLFVATEWNDTMTKRFVYKDGVTLLNPPKDCYAATYEVMRKSDGVLGVLVVFTDYKGFGGSKIINILTHESTHATMDFMKQCGIDPDSDNDEPIAYLIGWVASCCWKTLQKVIYAKKDE